MSEVKDGVKIELLRLSPPLFNNNIWNMFKITEMEKISFDKDINDNISLSNEISLSLPINSRKVYIGQNFKSQINISSNLKNNIQVNLINVDIWTRDNNFNIYKNEESVNISPNTFFSFVTCFPVYFFDVFTIRCTAEYKIGSEKKKLKKDFNFISRDPFNIRYSLVHKNDKLYMQIIMKNTEEDNIMLNDIILKDIKCELIKNEGCNKVHNGIHYFKQHDEYSMIFRIDDEKSKRYILNNTLDNDNITNMEIIYFTNNGGKGIHNLHYLKKNTSTDNFKIYLKENNNIYYTLNKIYNFEIIFENNTDEDMFLEIFVHNNSNIHIVNNFVKEHIIKSKTKKSHFFYTLFINQGIHFFNNITIYDKKNKTKKEYIKLFKLFVK
ncbi:conserved protein, unknown function [Plasmodium reichenowi]|uniref:Trafficking protein particle complex subunit 13 N-terminal domain-containing protein n=1 Tax=Plasmodium reichenowi TaxID=5854 RepID=A0A060RP31_PLARE|nr:conserved protein, unknown function [Plasmodium reichenowi]KYO01450.1 conserved protein, unknown function [Plasmodium reichenowi]CDO62902.1 conserved protein, unknown function [Plasmodium reichenowi]